MPVFAADQLKYEVLTGPLVTSITITASVYNSTTQILINGNRAGSGVPFEPK
ncbi:hypothetical protein Elgi_67380 [Paenibacillus elgii]|uniref:cadherin-like beta sandwich domain-containing protein n=1 Tax=Paenibacillus elgii TaxID=189691 RepID=UPI002D7BF540|nr:hypothetical protein Elgi_67380 [Paenibacillus elgii]